MRTRGTTSRAVRVLLAAASLLAVVSLSCSLAQLAGGPDPRALPTPTRTAWPTFTPLAGTSPGTGGGEEIRGALPPGVTAAAPSRPTETAQGDGTGKIILYATPTAQFETPQATGTAVASATLAATPTRAGPTPTPYPTPYVVVNTGTLAARRGPGPSFELLGEVRQGQQLMVLARTTDKQWWQVCCVANQPAWISANAVTAQGPVEAAPALPIPPTPTLTITPTPTRTLTPSPTPAPPFDIARGPEFPIQRDDGILVVWVKVFEGPPDNQKPLPGYMLKVFRNGVDVSKPTLSHGGDKSGFDKTGTTLGNYQYNLKFEMDFGGEADWEIYLTRPDGSRVSPITKFTTMGDSWRNLTVFIAYWLAR